jgi:hypothetical protein
MSCRLVRITIFLVVLVFLLVLSAALAPPIRAQIQVSGVYCHPETWVIQGTQFTHFNAMNPGDTPGMMDLNNVVCTAWLATADVQLQGGGFIPGRPIRAATVTFYAVREDGSVGSQGNAVTDIHGMATIRFDNLPVTGSQDHANCADTPSGTWECYTFYATYSGLGGGLPISMGFGECLLIGGCTTDWQYLLLEDSEVPIDCGGLAGCFEEYGGICNGLGTTIYIPAGSLAQPTMIEIAQPTPPPPAGIPPGAAMIDWRYISTSGATFALPATVALDYSSSIIYGYGRLGTQIYFYQSGRSQWVPLPTPPDRSALENQIRWEIVQGGFYALVGFTDSDLDGIENVLETSQYNTNPNLPDSDFDGGIDGNEILAWSTMPDDPDCDGDGHPDGEEVLAGTDPNDPRIYPGAIDRGDHNVGSIQTTMTDKGTFGYVTADLPDGVGFIYPPGGSNLLYIGSLWAGTDPDYVVNRDYASETPDWEVAANPDGHVVIDTTPDIAQRIRSSYNDSPHPQAKWLRAYQETAAWGTAPDNAYVLEHIVLANDGSDAVEDLYAGQFMDFDVIPASAAANYGTTDLARDLVYMWRAAPTPYVGLMLIEPEPVANVTLIHNPTYVWPNAHVLDADKYAFLAATDAAHIVHDAPAANDWSVLVSAGPFDLDVDESVTLGFALVAGSSAAELLANADRARAHYFEIYGGSAVGEPVRGVGGLRLTVAPNPFTGETVFYCTLPVRGRATLTVYDVAGRIINSWRREAPAVAGDDAVRWDGRDAQGRRLPPGVYLYRLDDGSVSRSGRLVLTR